MRNVLVALLFLSAAPVVAQTADPAAASAAPATATPAKPAKPKLVCVREDELGSRLGGHKTCMTAEQWHARQQDSRNWTENTQRQTAGRPY